MARKSLAGLIFKANYAAAHYADEFDLEAAASIVDDLLDKAGEGWRGRVDDSRNASAEPTPKRRV